MSCSGPILACGREVQPPISSTGMRASEALAIAVTVLVTPGPAVTMATPKLPGQLGMGVRHVHGGAFVAHVDDADAQPGDVIPDRLDVAALQAEDAVDAARLEEARDPRRAGLLVGVEIVRLVAGLLMRSASLFGVVIVVLAGRDAGSCRSPSAASPLRAMNEIERGRL